jgi:serine/threonine protein phosphatase 1
MNAPRLIAIGDVHGCAHALDALLEAIDPAREDRIVLLGDMIDQGRDTRAVLDRLIGLKKQCQVTLIQGNHEEMMYGASRSLQALRHWEMCGGVATLNSYRFCGTFKDIPREHWALLDECVPFLEMDRFILTHASYLPDLPMASQPGYQLRWALFEPEMMQPQISGKTVVVGHTEQRNAEILDLRFAMCIDTACWKYGWLTAIDLPSRKVWQASRWGMLREEGEATHRESLSALLRRQDL